MQNPTATKSPILIHKDQQQQQQQQSLLQQQVAIHFIDARGSLSLSFSSSLGFHSTLLLFDPLPFTFQSLLVVVIVVASVPQWILKKSQSLVRRRKL